ncbi:MAG: Transcriptional regulator, AcrR family [uncultured Caballeronia sp.]|nr:MAG: Transcriptional regulator, AcrR family [uncultured Caballeronia sp.]
MLAAALTIFTSQGFSQANVGEIAEIARVTRGAFYHHFEDKQALFEALVVSLQADAAEQIRAHAVAEPNVEARVMAGAAAFLDSCMEPAYRRLVIQDAPAVLGELRCREISEAYPYGLLIAAVTELRRPGGLIARTPYLVAGMIGSMICEAALLLDGAGSSEEELKQQALSIVARVFAAFSCPPA